MGSPKSKLLLRPEPDELPVVRTLDHEDGWATDGDISRQRFERVCCCNDFCVSAITFLNLVMHYQAFFYMADRSGEVDSYRAVKYDHKTLQRSLELSDS